MKCHWCQKTLLATQKDDPNYLECPDVHALITLDRGEVVHYVLYHDVNNIRYRLTGDKGANFTVLVRKFQPKGYKEMLTIKFLPLKIVEDNLQTYLILDKMKKLVIFS